MNVIYVSITTFLCGVFLSTFFFSLPYVLAETKATLTELEKDQEKYFKETGEYFEQHTDTSFQVHTYESLCKGYYVEQKNGDKTEFIGYGDKAKDFTYTIFSSSTKSSSQLNI